MIRPLRENLEVYTDGGDAQIRCAKCAFVLTGPGGDWRKSSKRKLLAPTAAGPLMEELVGKYLLEQLYCPSCSALFDTGVVEATQEGGANS